MKRQNEKSEAAVKERKEVFEMKRLDVSCTCSCVYRSFIDVPDEMSLREAVCYAKEHFDEIPVGEISLLNGTNKLEEEMCGFFEYLGDGGDAEKGSDDKYPVSKEVCRGCGACSLVTKHIGGASLDPEDYYYQCLAMAEDSCREVLKDKEHALLRDIRISSSAVFCKIFQVKGQWRYPWLIEVIKRSLEYLSLEGLQDAKRSHDIPEEILEICEHVLRLDGRWKGEEL